MKIRIGFGLGTGASNPSAFGALVDGLERHGFDSLWLSERVTGAGIDPVVGLAVAAGRTQKLKLGFSVLVLPGRNPVLLAKELATLDALSNGRLLPAFGLGVADPNEQQAFGVERSERASRFDEALPLLRRLWREENVDHDGRYYSYKALTIRPKPLSKMEVWLGGRAPSELRRVGRLGDGWLPSFSTPGEVAEGRVVIEKAAEAAGRSIDPEHYGALVIYHRGGPLPDRLAALVQARRPGADPREVFPSGASELRAHLQRFIDVGFSKFVVVPAGEPPSWDDELAELGAGVLSLQN